MTKRQVQPSIRETAFSCPYCGAYTTQHWLKLFSEYLEKKNPKPKIPIAEAKENIESSNEYSNEMKPLVLGWVGKMLSKEVFLDKVGDKRIYTGVYNLHLSQCYNCDKISVWLHDLLIYPNEKGGVEPNQDLPEEIIQDFEEARSIVNLSPRGAAALLRLSIQKLCLSLGEQGKDLDKDIASLVSKGLDPLIQKSLDIVRVIGNESVHPGRLDLKDDRDTAIQLFGLINSITDQMITHRKNVEQMYKKLPEAKRVAIELRDKKK